MDSGGDVDERLGSLVRRVEDHGRRAREGLRRRVISEGQRDVVREVREQCGPGSGVGLSEIVLEGRPVEGGHGHEPEAY